MEEEMSLYSEYYKRYLEKLDQAEKEGQPTDYVIKPEVFITISLFEDRGINPIETEKWKHYSKN